MGVIIVLRLIHVGFAIFWGGSVMFINFLLGPSLTAAGPEGFRVLGELNQRRYFDVMLAAATLTILSGAELMRRDSGGFNPSWFHTPFGIGLSAGMVAALVAYIFALVLIKPTLQRMAAIGASLATATPDDRPRLGADLNAQRARLLASGMVSMLFLLLAIAAMATARYL